MEVLASLEAFASGSARWRRLTDWTSRSGAASIGHIGIRRNPRRG